MAFPPEKFKVQSVYFLKEFYCICLFYSVPFIIEPYRQGKVYSLISVPSSKTSCVGGCDDILKQLTEICGTGPPNLSGTTGIRLHTAALSHPYSNPA
ncbi:DNA topoisomerase 3-alpha [Bienertia sinuspersici]